MKGTAPTVDYVTSPPELGEPLRVWEVSRLWKEAEALPVLFVPLSSIKELESVRWYGQGDHCGRLTVREVAEHARRIQEADTGKPVLLSAEGYLLDGFHRLARAWLDGRTEIPAKRFACNPEPDRVRSMPEWLTKLCLQRLRSSVGASCECAGEQPGA